ncbi:hypothetical protein AB5N19_12400 [Seiridium cardinale]|uniref:UDP-glucose 6-dehydrogenase n=1 Tax=Seiridium cardinale TaxID=138064 RepID=A0ABR2XTZ2_9PEZI
MDDMDGRAHPSIKHICFIGAGYVGGPTAAVIAQQRPDIQVTIVDRNEERIAAWKTDELPIREPGLLETVKVARDGLGTSRNSNLHFTTQMKESIQRADTIIVSVDTPTKTKGIGAGFAADTSRLEEVIMSIAKFARSDKIVVEKSTAPVGTGYFLRNLLNSNAREGVAFEVLSNPEFLAEGTAITNLLSPDRVLIGSLETRDGLAAAQALVDVYASWVPRARIVTTNLFSSELAKLAANAMLAQRISSVNALSAVCEATGADVQQVAAAVGRDVRIGPLMLRASYGFGGSCFQKDVRSLVYLCRYLHLDDVAKYWEAILHVNEGQVPRCIGRIVARFNGNLNGKRVAVLGFAFKENTSDTRESCAIAMVRGLLEEGAEISVYDPWVPVDQIRRDLGAGADLTEICKSAEEACGGAHIVVVATNWDIFRATHRGGIGIAETINATNGIPTPAQSSRTSVCSGPEAEGVKDIDEQEMPDFAEVEAPGQATPDSSDASDYVNWRQLSDIMKYPKMALGSSECLDSSVLVSLGFEVHMIGRGVAME